MLTRELSEYISLSSGRPLPREVAEAGALHLADTVAAIVSGSRLPAGRKITAHVAAQGGNPECSLVATDILTSPVQAALANGMFAHADETDDSHAPSLTHPGCAVVPAALVMAERHGRSGTELLRAVVLGYDVGTRLAMALGGSRFADRFHLSSHAWGGTFGAAAAACALAGLDAGKTAHAISYAVQMASGNRCWIRDPDHVQKAFVFGGMPASSGVQSALMAAEGFTGAASPLESVPGLLAAFSADDGASRLVDGLGEHFEILQTTIKKWCVGSPVQAALDAIESICREEGLGAGDVANIVVTLPEARVQVVDSAMPNINLRHVLALYLGDGGVTFESLHDAWRMHDAGLEAIRERIRVEPRPGAARHELAELTLVTRDGRTYRRAPEHVRGQPANPMNVDEVAAKARDLVIPVLGSARGGALIDRLLRPEDVANVAELRELWRA